MRLLSKGWLKVDYFHHGYPYDAIVGLLRRDGFAISVRTLKRKLVELGLSRKRNIIDEEAITQLIRQEIQGAGTLAGYRTIWQALRLKYGVHVPRNLVARIVREIDPEGVELRKSRRLTRRKYISLGPNFCWQIDGWWTFYKYTSLPYSLYLAPPPTLGLIDFQTSGRITKNACALVKSMVKSIRIKYIIMRSSGHL